MKLILHLLILFALIPNVLRSENEEKIIFFNYDNEDLVNVINYIASKKEANILLPSRTEDRITGKLTWHLDKKVTIDEAWNILTTILDIAGYNIVPKGTYYEIIKSSRETTHQPMPLYLGIPPDQLPETDQHIRYLYYLANVKPEAEGEGELGTILKTLLPVDAVYKIDSATNAILIMAPARDIKSIMSLLVHLDQPGFQETFEIIKLKHTEATLVANLFNNNIMQKDDLNRYRLDTQKKSEASYFSKHVRIIAQERTNSLIILGRAQAISRIREFINHYIDVEQGTGKSILHIYQLQYLDAPSLAKVLENIIQSKKVGGLEQATGERKAVAGPHRYFDDVRIAVDTPEGEGGESEFKGMGAGAINGENGRPISLSSAKYYGGNKLIIACRNDDWKRIRELIERLDKPQPQVLIEILIADLTLDDSRALGSLFRNPEKFPMPGQMNLQAAHVSPGVMPDSFDNPQTIGVIKNGNGAVQAASDLLRQFHVDADGNRSDTGDPLTDVAKALAGGSTVLSLNDSSGKTWGITQILKVIDSTKILSHPHIISTSNQEAKIEISETRVLRDQASGSQGGTIVATRKQIPASLKVRIIPRISISEIRSNTVNLQVLIDINEYKSTTDNTQITRNVTTNASVISGDILALGGLLRTNESDSIGETPVLSKIPIIGWLFKRRQKTQQRTNLTVFISPTVIEPRLRSGIGDYTKDYLNISKEYAKGGQLFDALKDPITRWFFTEESPTEKFTDEFMKQDETLKTPPPAVQHRRDKQGSSIVSTVYNSQGKQVSEDKIKQIDQIKQAIQDVDNPFKNVKIQ